MNKPELIDRIVIVPIGWMIIGSVLTRRPDNIDALDWTCFGLILVCMIFYIIQEIFSLK